MGYSNTKVLQLQVPDLADAPLSSYVDKITNDQALSSSLQSIDQWAAIMTGSCYTLFQLSGSASDQLGDAGGLGAEYTRTDRVIQEVVAFAATSGSGGVSTIDIQVQQGPVAPANFSTVFPSTNNADRVALSASLGNYGVARKASFVSGSNTVWPANTLLRAILVTAAGAAGVSGQKNIQVQVFWKPSASYGA